MSKKLRKKSGSVVLSGHILAFDALLAMNAEEYTIHPFKNVTLVLERAKQYMREV